MDHVTAMEYILTQMGEYIQVNGTMIDNKVMVNKYGLMVHVIKDIIMMDTNQVKVV